MKVFQYVCTIRFVEFKEIAESLNIKKQNVSAWCINRGIPQKYNEYMQGKLGYSVDFLNQELTTENKQKILIDELKSL